jgi:hypothetical protein
MISERTLRNWRRNALKSLPDDTLPTDPRDIWINLKARDERILRLTQELLDLHLVKKG